jgi:hypothetical protein
VAAPGANDGHRFCEQINPRNSGVVGGRSYRLNCSISIAKRIDSATGNGWRATAGSCDDSAEWLGQKIMRVLTERLRSAKTENLFHPVGKVSAPARCQMLENLKHQSCDSKEFATLTK